MKSPVPIMIATLVGAAVIAVVVYNFQRETTSIETKYAGKTGDEIDVTYNFPLFNLVTGPDYDDNITPGGPATPVNLGDDPDYDGLTNAREQALGTDINDPDTDNDGTSDGIEDLLGTDPTDPSSGGVKIPSLTSPGQTGDGGQTGQSVVSVFYKYVKNLGEEGAVWSHYANAKFGEDVTFLIHIEATNPSSELPLLLPIKDYLGKHLQYISQSGYIRVNQGESQLLPDTWLINYPIYIAAQDNPDVPVLTKVEITFNALLKADPTNNLSTTLNQATLSVGESSLTDTAFIKLIS
ncbi:MAG: thrombospondin type 3 repeat-containing protein [Patescibacteria group bacterium]